MNAKGKPTRLAEDTSLWADLRENVRRLVRRLVQEKLGDDVFEMRPRSDTGISHRAEPPAAEALRLAILTQSAARSVAAEYAAVLRGDGVAWRDIFPLLGIDDPTGYNHAEKAYEHFAPFNPDRPHDPRSFGWRCATCCGYVSDYGPFNGVAEDEKGHAADCTRHAAEIAAANAWRDED